MKFRHDAALALVGVARECISGITYRTLVTLVAEKRGAPAPERN
jgi:hypothetical protein